MKSTHSCLKACWREPSPWSSRLAIALAAVALPLLCIGGCRPRVDTADAIPISWTGAPATIERMVSDYLQTKVGAPTLLKPGHYAKPSPFFLYEGNDDAVTLALSARLGTSYPPVDVYFIDLYWFSSFEPTWLESFQNRTIPISDQNVELSQVIPTDLRSACELDNQLYAVPLSIRGNCLFYRADLIPNPPRTWAELVAVTRQALAQAGPDATLRHGLRFHWNELHTDLYPVMWSYGGGPPNCLTAAGELDSPLASEPNLAALAMFYGLIHHDKITEPLAQIQARDLESEKTLYEGFARGETLFLIDWSNRAARIESALAKSPSAAFAAGHIGIAPIPRAEETKPAYSTIGSWGWVVSAAPRSPHSVDFVREMATPDAQLFFFEKHSEIPIFQRAVLEGLPQWPAIDRRLSEYHRQLLQLVHGDARSPGVVLRNRPGRKEINRIALAALHDVLSLPPHGEAGALDLETARARLARADLQIIRHFQQLERLGIDCSCDAGPPAAPGAALESRVTETP